MTRIRSLDGLRALSVIAVIVGHLCRSFTTRAIAHIGFIGVRVFFVISGLLITSLLIDEGSAVSLKRFYIRRALRILPLAYFFVLIVAVLCSAGWIVARRQDLIIAFTFLMSYYHPPFALAHLWSLSVEEQFYLLWPLAFVLARGRGKWVAVAVVVAGPLIRTAWWFLLPQRREFLAIAFPNVADAIAIGCVAAFDREWWAELGSRIPTTVTLLLPLWAWMIWESPPFLPSGILRKMFVPFVDSLVNVLLLLFVIGAIHCKGWLLSALNSRLLVFIGTISYSLYVWQQLFVLQSKPTIAGALVRLVVIFAVAISAHFVIERPFLLLKARLENKGSGARA